MNICETSNCCNSPIAICLHCKHQLCVEHLLQHNEDVIHQANVYCDEFNQLTEQIENMSFDQQFISVEDDLNEWANEQLKKLDKIYEEKLLELKQTQLEVDEKLVSFKENQRNKLKEIQHPVFNSNLSKQISIEQLNQMKAIIEQVQEDIHQFQTDECKIKLINNDQINLTSKPNFDQECIQIKKSQLSPNAKPFEYIPKDPKYSNSFSSIRQDDFPSRLFDGCAFVIPIHQSM